MAFTLSPWTLWSSSIRYRRQFNTTGIQPPYLRILHVKFTSSVSSTVMVALLSPSSAGKNSMPCLRTRTRTTYLNSTLGSRKSEVTSNASRVVLWLPGSLIPIMAPNLIWRLEPQRLSSRYVQYIHEPWVQISSSPRLIEVCRSRRQPKHLALLHP